MTENIFEKALEPALTRDNSAPTDYLGDDGLIRCGVCHQPKQYHFDCLGLNRIVPCICACEKAERDKREQKEKDEEIRQQIEALREYGLQTEQYKNSTFAIDDRADEKASATCKKYVDNWERILNMEKLGKGLLLHGKVGSGKTFLAACIANALIDKNIPVLFTSLPILVHKMTINFGDMRENVLGKVKSVQLLILDDFGSEQVSKTQLEKIYEIVNTRYQAHKPLIITTNLTMEKFKNPTDINYSRIYSRIQEMCPNGIQLEVENRRIENARAGHAEMQNILKDK